MLINYIRKKDIQNEENPYWMSFSDLMCGFLIIFILACIALMFELAKIKLKLTEDFTDLQEAIKELQQSENIRNTILKEIKTNLEKDNIEVIISEDNTTLFIPDKEFHFDTGSYTINQDMKFRAEKIGKVLFEALSMKNDKGESYTKFLDTVFIEGHTDIRKWRTERGNWDLSTLRAVSLWRFWIETTEYGQKLKELTNYEDKLLFSVSGYADTRPRVEGDTEEIFQMNRRINIRFTTKHVTVNELNSKIEGINGESK